MRRRGASDRSADDAERRDGRSRELCERARHLVGLALLEHAGHEFQCEIDLIDLAQEQVTRLESLDRGADGGKLAGRAQHLAGALRAERPWHISRITSPSLRPRVH